MFIRTARPSSAVRETLDAACAHQLFAELRMDDEAEALRVRFGRVEGDELHVQFAPSLDVSKAPVEGQESIVQWLIEGDCCIFRSQVRGVLITPGAGGRPRATGLVLDVPDQISRQQRRSSFRVPLAAHDNIHMSISQAASGRTDCCPLDGYHVRGRMVNLSAGGLCAIIHVEHAAKLCAGQQLFIDFTLPDVEREFSLLAEVCHVRPAHHGGGVLVGLRFLSGVPWPVEPLIQAITRFVTREERRRLQRKR